MPGKPEGPAPPQSSTSASRPAKRIPDFGPRYQVQGILGEGGMGTVYKAWDKELNRTVALKLVRRDLTYDPEVSQRFKQELLLASKISHRNILRIHDLGDGPDDTKFISMAYVDGLDLHHLLKKEKLLPLERALQMARQLCCALEAAHAEGVVHRDLKPQNILVDQHDHIYVSDFGLAKSLESDLAMTRMGQFLGTPRYMSPEQAETGVVDYRSDLYSFGLILCELVTAKFPFEPVDSTLQLMYQRVHERPENPKRLNPDLPDYLGRIIQKCLERDVRDRYQTASEILADLDAGHAPTFTHHSRIAEATHVLLHDHQRRRVPLAAIIVLLLAAGGITWRFSSHSRRSASLPPAAPQVTLAVLPFHNASGDASLDWLGSSLAETLGMEIGQSAELRTVSSGRLQQLFSDLKISSGTLLDAPTIQRIADFTNADRVVWGQYAKFGDQIRIDATIQDMKNGQSTSLAESATENALLPAIERLAGRVRPKLALSANSLKQLQGQSFQPSTNSLPAMREYSEGLQAARRGGFLDAAKRFQAATKEDAHFALAYSELGKAYADLGQDREAEQASQRAVELSDALPAPEKYRIQANYERTERDYPKAIEAYETLEKAVPGDADVLFELGELYENSSAYGKAREAYAQVLTLDPKRVEALLAMGRVEIQAGNAEKALEYLTRAQALAVQAGNDEEQAEILQNLGVAYASLNKHEEALRSLRDSLAIKRRLGLQRGIAMSLDAMAISEEALGETDQALKDYKQALTLWQELGDKVGMGDVLIDLGQFYIVRGQYDAALPLFKQALQAETEVGNQSNQALALNNIGNAYSYKADFQNARIYFEQAFELREKLKVPGDIADSLHNLAETFTKMGQYDLAIQDYLRALDLRRSTDDKRGAAIESSSLGILFGYQGRYGAALSSEEEALKTFRELQERGFWLAEVLGHYGNAQAQIGQSTEATKSLDEAMTVAQQLKNQEAIAEIQGHQGDNAFFRGDYAAAAGLFQEALKTASQSSDMDLRLISKFNAAKAAVQLGRSQSAANSLAKLSADADALGLKYVAVDCSLYQAQALLNLKSYEAAKRELENSLHKSQKLGTLTLLARSHYLLARTLELSGNASDAAPHYAEARKVLTEIQNDAKTNALVKRSDLSPIYALHIN